MRYIFFILLGYFFVGCSTKVNLNEYRPKVVIKSPAAPKEFKNIEHKAALVKLKSYYFKNVDLSSIAQSTILLEVRKSRLLKSLRLISSRYVKDYIKLAQIEKDNFPNIYFHLIKANIIDVEVTDRGTYHPAIYNKKGKLISKSYYSYEVCSSIDGRIFKLPSQDIEFSEVVNKCSSAYLYNPNYRIVKNLAIKATERSARYISDDFKKVFIPVGYVDEIRENSSHELIAHITLGKLNGVKQNMKVYFYRIIKTNNSTTRQKIGEGKVSQLIDNKGAWVTMDLDENIQPMIGDEVELDVDDSFFNELF